MNIAWAAFITIFSWSLGDYILSMVKDLKFTVTEKFIFSLGIGFGVAAYLVFLAGQINILYAGVFIPVILAVCLLSCRRLPGGLCRVASFVKGFRITSLSLFEKMLIMLLFGVFAFSLAGALAPAIGNDSLAYHLYHPRIFIETHSIAHIPHTRESLWPYLTEMLFTLGMLVKGPVVSKLLHYVFGVLSTIAVFCFARRFLGRKEGLIAAALFYLAPCIFMQASYAYIELALCFYVFGSFYLFFIWEKERNLWYLVLSGLFMGLAISTKILAGMALIPILLLLAFNLVQTQVTVRKAFKVCIAFLIPIFLSSFIWYLRSFMITGNPVYPFMQSLFGGGWTGYDLSEYVSQVDLGHSQGIIGFLRLPWDLVMNVGSFGPGEQIGFLFLALFPCLFFVEWKNSVNKAMLFFVLIFTTIWYAAGPNARYYSMIFPAIFLLYSSGLHRLLYTKKMNFMKWLISGGLCFNAMLACYYNLAPMKLLIGKTTMEEYLIANERTSGMAKWVNETLEKDAIVVVVNEPRMFYFRTPSLNYMPFIMEYADEKVRFNMFQDIIGQYPHVYVVVNSDKMDEIIKSLVYKKQALFSTLSNEDGLPYEYAIYKVK